MSGDHGGWIGPAARYYDLSFKTCRKQTRAYIASGKDPTLLSYLTAAPDQFQEAAGEGCNVGKASVTDPSSPPLESIPAKNARAIKEAVAKWLSRHPDSACQIVLSDKATCTLGDGTTAEIILGTTTGG